MRKLQTLLFVAHFCLMMIVIGGTIFSVMVEYPNWFANIPSSIATTRDFYKVLHPGYFFQIFAPLALFSGIAFALVGWRVAPARNLVLISVVIMVATELLTFLYIYPRLNIMFGPDAASNTIEVLRQAASDFTTADRIRTFLGFTAAGFSVAALMKFFRYRFELS
jgi:uncharacterized membrane protein